MKNANEYKLREAALSDISTLVEQRKTMFTEIRSTKDRRPLNSMCLAYRRYLDERLRSGRTKAWLVENQEGTVVAGGVVSINDWPPLPNDPSARRAYAFNMHTHLNHRRRGLARTIMETIIR